MSFEIEYLYSMQMEKIQIKHDVTTCSLLAVMH